jgi:hypothetical protein
MWISDTYRSDVQAIPVATILPDLVRAWLHFHTGLMLLAQSSELMKNDDSVYDAASDHISLVVQCLDRAEEAIVVRERIAKIKEHEVCGPSGLAYLFISSLHVDKLDQGTSVINCYRESLDRLVGKSLLMVPPAYVNTPRRQMPMMTKRRQRRRLHDDLTTTLHELRCLEVINTVHSQMIVQSLLARFPDFSIEKGAGQPGVGGQDPREVLALQVWERCHVRADRLSSLKSRSRSLYNWHERHRRSSKDRHETAIYIFTVRHLLIFDCTLQLRVAKFNWTDRDSNIPSTELRVEFLRHEHERHPQYGSESMAVLGSGPPGDRYCSLVVPRPGRYFAGVFSI